jgi:hypothetical protein
MNYFFALLCTCILISCVENNTSISKQKETPIDEKEFLNHEIINDSIEYRIKEYDKKNSVYRNICVFKNDELIKEKIIYKIQKKYLHDEGYNTASSKVYTMKSLIKFHVLDITTHYFDYNIESADTSIIEVIVTPSGEIVTQKLTQ